MENVPYFIGFTFGTLIAFIVRVGPKSIRLSVESSLVIFVLTAVSVSLAIKMITLEKVTLYFQRVSIALKGVGGAVVEVTSDKDLESHALIENGLKASSSSSSLNKENNQTTRTRINSTVVKTGASLDVKGGNKKNDGGVGNGFLRHSGSGDEEESEVLLDAREDGGGKSDLALAEAMFINLMVTTACVVSFAHGSNDVSNAIGPFTAIQEIWFTGQISTDSKPPVWILVGGGVGIVFGLGTYGHKVMATVGENIAKLTYSRGFTAQISTALTVLMATQLGLSVSTTHCLIGAITGVALVEGPDKINKATIKKIIMSWVITLPASAVFGVIIFWGFGFNDSTTILGNNNLLNSTTMSQ